ncbi:MAG: O-antigen ligase family protein [Solirubrobacterales bacterium]
MIVAARDLALWGVPVVAAGALVTVGPRAWVAGCVAVTGVALALVPTRSGERSAIGEILFVSVAVAVLFAGLNAIRPGGALTVSDLAILAALWFAVLGLVVDPDLSRRLTPPWWLIAAAGGLLVAGLAAELFPPGEIPELTDFGDPLYAGVAGGPGSTNLAGAVRLAGTLLLVPVLIASAADSPRRVNFLAELWIAGALVSAVVAIVGQLDVSLGPLSGLVHEFWREQAGLTVHPNMLGLISAMTLPILIARLGTADWRRRVYYIAVIAILVGAIGASGSRIALVSGVLGVALVLFLTRGTWKLAALLAAAAVVAIGATTVVDLGSVPVVHRLTTEGIVDQRRVILYEEVWEAIQARPLLGYGFQNLRGTHDVYLQLLQAGGLLALLSFLLFAAGTLTVGVRCGRSAHLPPDLRALARGLTASIAVWLLAVLVLNIFLDRFLYVPIGLLLGIAGLLLRAQASQPSSSTPVSVRSS